MYDQKKKKNILFFGNGALLATTIGGWLEDVDQYLLDTSHKQTPQISVRLFYPQDHPEMIKYKLKLPFLTTIDVLAAHRGTEDTDMTMILDMTLCAERNSHFTHIFILTDDDNASRYKTLISHLNDHFRSQTAVITSLCVSNRASFYMPVVPFCDLCKKKFRLDEGLQQHNSKRHKILA